MSFKICPKCNEKRDKELFLVYHKTAGFPDIVKYCRICRREKSKSWYSNNKEKAKLQNIKSRRNNIDKYRDTSNIRAKRYIDELTDDYIIQLLINNTKLKRDIIKLHPELIEIKRQIIKTKRL